MVRLRQFAPRRTLHDMGRELLLCVLLPSVVLVSVDMLAQRNGPATARQQSQQQSDDQIAAAINTRLMASNVLRPLDLGVWVHNGVATLSGAVPTQALRTQADSLVRAVPGVKSVDDQITVGAPQEAQPGPQSQMSPRPLAASPTPAARTAQAAPSQTRQSPALAAEGRPLISAVPGPVANATPKQTPSAPSAYAETAPNGPPIRATNSTPSTAQLYVPQNAPPNAAQLRRSQVQNDQPRMTIAAGTPLHVQLLQTLDSHHTKPGMGFRGVLAQSVQVNGVTALPRGAMVEGTVIDARPAGRLAGRPKLALQLSNINMGSASYVLTTQDWAHQGPGKGGQTAGAVAGGAAFGAIAGAIFGGGPVALLGAAIGGLGGAGLSALSPGAHILAPAESVLTFRLTAPLIVREPTVEEVQSMEANAPQSRPVPRYRRRVYYPYPPPYPPPYYYPY